MVTPRERLLREETTSLVRLLSDGGQGALVIVLAADGDDALLGSAVTPQLTASTLAAFVLHLDNERARFAAVLAKAQHNG